MPDAPPPSKPMPMTPAPTPDALPPVGPPAGEALRPRFKAMLPEQLLQNGETIILLLKPSPLYIVLAPLTLLAWLAAIGAAGVALDRWLNQAQMSRQIVLMTMLAILLRLGWQTLEWLSRTYVLTDRRVIRVKGVLQVQVFEAPLPHIQHTETVFSLRERLFALGTLTFSTSGGGGIEAAWLMVAHPLEVHRKVVATLRR